MYLSDKFADDIARAAENVKDHKVSLIMKNGANELWRCTRGNSSCYGFDLVISRFGMAMYGDTDSHVFNVGASYGTEFLARKSLDGYYISKLEENSRPKSEVDVDALRALLAERGVALLERYYRGDADAVPDEFETILDNGAKPEQLDAVISYLRTQVDNDNPGFEMYSGTFDSWLDAVDTLMCEHGDKLEQGPDVLYAYLNENSDELNLGEDWYETSLRTYNGRLIQCLEMLRLCAVKIEQFKKENPPSDGNESW